MCLAYCPPSFLKYIVSRSTLDLIPELCIPHSAFIPHSFPPVAPLLRHCRRTFGVIIASGGYGTRTPVPVRRKEGRRKPLHLGRCGCTKNMYIELFLLDNFLMNLLTLRAAAAMLSLQPSACSLLACVMLLVMLFKITSSCRICSPRAAQCS